MSERVSDMTHRLAIIIPAYKATFLPNLMLKKPSLQDLHVEKCKKQLILHFFQ